jgi:hypothetical protein
MIFSQTIGSQKIVLECAAALEPAAGDIFKTFAGLDKSGKTLHPGFSVRFGWSMLTLADDPQGLRICEPRFSGDALHELNPTVDTTIHVLVSQIEWLRRVGERAEDVYFDQQLVFAPNALTAPQIFALRGERSSDSDSGWSLAPVPAPGRQIDTGHLSAMPIYGLVASHPGLLSILTLPQGFLVRLEAGQVVEIDGADGASRWRA